MEFHYYMPSKILFGKNKLEELHQHLTKFKKALIVTSAGDSMRKYGYLDRLIKQLELAGVPYVLFPEILPNPILKHVTEGAKEARAGACDVVIGLGGGSSLDSAKSIAVMATNEGSYWDYIGDGTGKGLPVQNGPLPVIAITTTAGTGTESDPWTVITNEKTNEKIGFGYEKTFPFLSVVDPSLMMSVPKDLTAYQGFDALFHSTEGYINITANPMSDLFALKSIDLIGKSLSKAVSNGNDETARADVALANTLSGFVESTSGCTSEHSLEHALSAFHPNLPHGAGLIMISKAYYTYFAENHACDQRLMTMARVLGKADATKPLDFVEALCDLQKACFVDKLKMSDYGIKETELQKYVDNAYDTMGGLFKVDPMPIDKKAALEILKKSYQ